jgi:16S rRNA (cytidine1402-2'-O)-methyltransferase
VWRASTCPYSLVYRGPWTGERRRSIGTLYLVATPIGNLEDITLRALRVLRDSSLIAAEDTRHSGRLLTHFGITTPRISFHEHSDPARIAEILDALANGDVALISDAGTPGISDPGFALVKAALAAGIAVSPIPGPSALTAAVPLSALAPDGFLYLGFLPRRKQERRATLSALRDLPYPLVLYEAPHRLSACLDDIEATLGDRPLAIARELTKLHEEIVHTTVQAARERYAVDAPRGEFVLIIGPEPQTESAVTIDDPNVLDRLRERLLAGDSPSAAARAVARELGLPRSAVYERLAELKRMDE